VRLNQKRAQEVLKNQAANPSHFYLVAVVDNKEFMIYV